MSDSILATPTCAEPAPTDSPAEQNPDSGFSPAVENRPLEKLAIKWVQIEARHTEATLGRADLLYHYLCRSLGARTGGDRREARATLIAEAKERIRQQGFDCRASRLLGIRGVAEIFGRSEAGELSPAVLAELVPLCRRIRNSEDWAIRPEHERSATALWRRIFHDRLGAPAVRKAVAKVRGRNLPAPQATPTRRPPIATWARRATESEINDFVANLPDDMLDYLSGLIAPDGEPTADSPPTLEIGDIQPPPTTSVAGLFRRLGG